MCNITKILKRYVATDIDTTNKLLGAAAIVVNKTGILYSGAAGKIDFPSDAPRFSLDTFGWIASMSKLITAVAVLQFVDQGILGLGEDLRPIVPELDGLEIIRGWHDDGLTPKVEKNVLPVTLRQLLSHTSGMTYDLLPGYPDLARYNEYINRTDNTFSFTKSGFLSVLTSAPGEAWSYGPGVDWVGQLIERISGKTLDVYLRERIFVPLGMETTVFFPEVPPSARAHETVLPLRMEDGLLGPMNAPMPAVQEFKSGGAGLSSTASDYARFLRALLAGELLGERMMELLFTSCVDDGESIRERLSSWAPGFCKQFDEGTPMGQALGGVVTLRDIRGKRRARSMAWGGASNSQWWIDRKTGVACVLFVNQWPWGDEVVGRLWDELERAVYKDISLGGNGGSRFGRAKL
ncbi:beta-lactamase [Pterulicium gracile]|uniref:Beta-lactamase n=1 Tax=Pterulicium gracile TaxID=1884261 RepID=A0A5C3QTN4_9AGAR|nr:beta-lactamase [Pterula gracilis]